ncbi:MAG TPA: ATP synthase F1 subunit delta [Thermoanaerobaculia bacterium]|nr:ATP synthase F1 subunit delta [Thermoanaerobaculia bacterium]
MTSRAAGTRYARALFDVALKESDVQQAGRDLNEFAQLVSGNAALARVLSNPAVPAPQKRGIVEQLLARVGTVTPSVVKLLSLLADRDRLVLLPDVAAAYRNRLMEHAKVVRAELVTAIPLPPDRLAALQQRLASVTGRQVQLENRVDPAIIGGAIARIGSTVYDGSVTRQLEKMKEALVTSA